MTVVLNNPVQTLETVRVTALSSVGLSARGFYERQKNSKGKFFDPEYLIKRRGRWPSLAIATFYATTFRQVEG